ncbi:M1 family metallopeptidase [Streptomyces sp. 7N604]|uniref:M1 family metallopeptidase n=1 Tax=Streptomyces sp. 7N604 TaxID=3457415 RepID=UPI003FD46CF5
MRPTVRISMLAAALAALLAVPGAGLAERAARPVPAAATARTDAGPAHLAYDIRLRADATATRWTGRQTVSFTNTGGTPLREVYLRLWGNAWDGCGPAGRTTPVQVTRVEGGTARGLSAGCTALRVDLPEPLPHGARGTVGFDLAVTVPDRAERFGRHGPYRFLGNALPVLAVRDATHGWHLDPDVGFGESYYTLAADFRVRLDHPSALNVPTTGTATTRRGEPGGRTVTTATARQARDFAFAAGPFRTATALSPSGIRITAYRTAATPAPAADAARRVAAEAVDDFGARFGRYPYGEVDLVLHDGFDATGGDMEYPGLVLLNAGSLNPGSLNPGAAGSATVHEVAHQWWYGIIGNDQFGSPWLDEAFAVYAEDVFRGDHRPGCRPAADAARSMGHWAARGGGAWKAAVYEGGSCALHDLEREIGGPAMARLLRNYARDRWYGVSTTATFQRAAEAVAHKDLGPFWREHGIR